MSLQPNVIRVATNLNIIILRKTTESKPSRAKISSSVVSQAFTIQLGEGTNLSKQKVSQCFNFLDAIFRPKYTVMLLGCFRNIEYREKSITQMPILIPTEVRSAENSISLYFLTVPNEIINTKNHPKLGFTQIGFRYLLCSLPAHKNTQNFHST